MTEQNTGWRDISTAPTGPICLFRSAGDFVFSGFVSDDIVLAHGSPFGCTIWEPTHWQPLPPPPGEEGESIFNMSEDRFNRLLSNADHSRRQRQTATQNAVESTRADTVAINSLTHEIEQRREEMRALQSRCDELEVAARDALQFVEVIEKGGRDEGDEYAATTIAKALRSVVDGGE